MPIVAAIQMSSTGDSRRNLERAGALVERAAGEGASFVALPETVDFIGPAEEKRARAQPLDGAYVETFREAAVRQGIWLLAGSFAERIEGSTRIHNTSPLLAPDGSIAAVYRKIHLFDADPPDGVPYRESTLVEAGSEVITAPTPLGTVGLSICYDLRFPELYRAQAAAGAQLLFVPSAFTVPTGQAHWEILLRARAIENLAFVVAPAQSGEHGRGRRSFGHAMVVGPWGDVLAGLGAEDEGITLADLDLAAVERARTMLPALAHRRLPA